MIGHPQGASGAAGVVESLLAMRDSFLPPTINHDAPDPECDLDVIPNVGRERRIDTVLGQLHRLRLEERGRRPPTARGLATHVPFDARPRSSSRPRVDGPQRQLARRV